MSHKAVRHLLEARLATWSAARLEELPIVWQNTTWPEPDGIYLRAFLLPALTESEDLAGVHRAYVGVFQVTIVTVPGVGAGAVEGVADELAALFPNNLRLTGTGFAVQVITPMAVGTAVQESDSYQLPVSLTYRADTV